jgi:predicted dehydrogenase
LTSDTDWRKVPTHQGGFLLDGGVHYTAGLRYLLGPDTFITRLSAFTTLLKEHLPPVDTVDAIFKANTGIQGTFQVSNGTSLVGPEWTIGCENGSVSVEGPKITIRTLDGKEDVQNVDDERTGVPPEVRQWGVALAAGKPNPEQSPSQALADLELVSQT